MKRGIKTLPTASRATTNSNHHYTKHTKYVQQDPILVLSKSACINRAVVCQVKCIIATIILSVMRSAKV